MNSKWLATASLNLMAVSETTHGYEVALGHYDQPHRAMTL